MIIPIVVFLTSFLFYLVTLNGTVPTYRDSGDLINAVHTLGIAHPPGYPLYIFLGKVFTRFVPFASPAYRVNLFSAVCASGAAAILYFGIRRILTSRPESTRGVALGAAFAGALIFAFTPAVQSLARVSEMYTLTAVFAGGIMLCWRMRTPQAMALGAFLLGLGFGVHPTLVVLTPLLFTIDPREAGIRLGFFLLGFSVVAMLWVRAQTGPIQNWGDPSTLENLWKVITRSNYGGLKLHPVESHFSWTLAGGMEQAAYFGKTLFRQWGGLGILAGSVGLAVSFKKDVRLVIAWFLAGPCFMLLSNLSFKAQTTASILEPYFVLVNLIWAVWVACGFYEGLQRARPGVARAAVLIACLCVPIAELRASMQSYRSHFYAYDLGRNIFRTLPSRSVVYDPDDPIAFTLRMLQITEHRREDVALLNFTKTRWGYEQILRRWPDLLPPIPLRSAMELDQALWSYSINKRPFFVDLPFKLASTLSYDVSGIVYRVKPPAQAAASVPLTQAETLELFYVWRGVWNTSRHPDFFTQHLINYRAAARCNLGLKYAERQDWGAAQRCYLEALVLDPVLSAAYNNWGVADFNQGKYQNALINYQQALRYDPTNTGYRQNLDLAQERLSASRPPVP